MLSNSESVCTICSGGELPQFLRGILGGNLGMTFKMQAAGTITAHLRYRKTLHTQKVIDMATGLGSKTTLRPL